jgi:hypothetical protein
MIDDLFKNLLILCLMTFHCFFNFY